MGVEKFLNLKATVIATLAVYLGIFTWMGVWLFRNEGGFAGIYFFTLLALIAFLLTIKKVEYRFGWLNRFNAWCGRNRGKAFRIGLAYIAVIYASVAIYFLVRGIG